MRPAESFIGQPIRSLQTMLRVIAEYDGSVSTVVPDGIYGAETAKSVTLFQQINGLPPTGVTDLETWEAIVKKYDEAFISVHKADPIEIVWDANRIFMVGDRSPYIYLAQSMLIFLSQVDSSITRPEHNGVLDSATSEAITDFQKLNDLPNTGQLDKRTWKHLSRQFTLHATRAENQLL